MEKRRILQRLKERYRETLDPVDRISEVLFGLIMVLTFTGSISVASDGRAEISELLWAALGCNVAWGIVDGVMFLMSSILERGHGLNVLKSLKSVQSEKDARTLIKNELPPLLSAALTDKEIDSINERLCRLNDIPKRKLLTGVEFRGAIFIFFLVFTCTLPVSLPFVFFSNTAAALRTSNITAVLILFAGGYSVGKYAGFHPFKTGIMLMILGILLVAITMALGG